MLLLQKLYTMKNVAFLALTILLFFTSCKKDNVNPDLAFTNNLTEGTANASGEYTITGHISSEIKLAKVVLTVEGQNTPFLVDESTASNKLEYDFSYLVTGVTANTYIIIDVYDQDGGKNSSRFLIRK